MAEDVNERFRNLRKVAQDRRQNQGESRYSPFGPSAYPYEESFRGILHDLGVSTFTEFLEQRFQESGRPQIVLDLMAPPSSFLNKLVPSSAFGGGVAVTLGKVDDPKGLMTTEGEKKIYVVSGDIFQGSTWRQVDIGLEEMELVEPTFDIEVCRAEGPLIKGDHLNFEDLPLLSLLLKRSWKRLNPNGGQIFTQLPTFNKPNISYSKLLGSLPRVADQNKAEAKVFLAHDSEYRAFPVVRFTKMPTSSQDFLVSQLPR